MGNGIVLRCSCQSPYRRTLGGLDTWSGLSSKLFDDLLTHDFFSVIAIVKTNASWEPGSGCVSHTAGTAVIATSISTLVFDFIVLALSSFRLMRGSRKSRLVNLLFKDGLIYLAIVYASLKKPLRKVSRIDMRFVCSFISSIIAAVLASLRLNPVMDVIGAFPAHFVHLVSTPTNIQESFHSLKIYCRRFIFTPQHLTTPDRIMSFSSPVVELFIGESVSIVRFLRSLSVNYTHIDTRSMTAVPRNPSVIAFQPRDSDYPTSSSTLGRMTPYSDGDGKSDGVQIQVRLLPSCDT